MKTGLDAGSLPWMLRPVRGQPTNNQLVKKLILHLDYIEPSVRRNAARRLGKLGLDAHEAVSSLTKLLRDEDLDVCYETVIALGKIRIFAEGAIPDLCDIRANAEYGDRLSRAADWALWQIRDSGDTWYFHKDINEIQRETREEEERREGPIPWKI